MEDTVTISRAEYEALIDAREDLADIAAIDEFRKNPQDGLPFAFMKRLILGDAPVTVFREWRGLNQSELARASGVNRVQIADIEAGRKTGSVTTLRKLADTLGVTVDDLI